MWFLFRRLCALGLVLLRLPPGLHLRLLAAVVLLSAEFRLLLRLSPLLALHLLLQRAQLRLLVRSLRENANQNIGVVADMSYKGSHQKTFPLRPDLPPAKMENEIEGECSGCFR